MQSSAITVSDYVASLAQDRKEVIEKLRNVINDNLPEWFQECMSYGMIWYVVPHSLYPAGYHCTPELPLPFVAIASQKNFVAFYHMCIYGSPELLERWQSEYPKYCKRKLDMGKSCVRFKWLDDIPYELIGELMKKITVEKRIQIYEQKFKN